MKTRMLHLYISPFLYAAQRFGFAQHPRSAAKGKGDKGEPVFGGSFTCNYSPKVQLGSIFRLHYPDRSASPSKTSATSLRIPCFRRYARRSA